MTSTRKNKRPCARIIGACCFLAIAAGIFGATLTGYRTHFVHGNYYPVNTLGYTLFTNFVSLTNGASVELTSSRTLSKATWNTNFAFWPASNITAVSLVQSNTGHDWTKFSQTLISPVVSIGAGHAPLPTNSYLLFVDRTNGQHWRRISAIVSSYTVGTNDYVLSGLSSPVPVETMPICLSSNLASRLPAGIAAPVPIVQRCQHARVLSEFISLGSSHAWESGDSGSGAFVVVSNRCVFVPIGYASPQIGNLAQLIADLNTVTTAAGYTTNTYYPVFETFTNWPAWPYQ